MLGSTAEAAVLASVRAQDASCHRRENSSLLETPLMDMQVRARNLDNDERNHNN